jgi:hypothetical protein
MPWYRFGPYRVGFVSFDCEEPPHIHVKRERFEDKFWLNPVQHDGKRRRRGFGEQELGRIERLLREHQAFLLERWNEHCS